MFKQGRVWPVLTTCASGWECSCQNKWTPTVEVRRRIVRKVVQRCAECKVKTSKCCRICEVISHFAAELRKVLAFCNGIPWDLLALWDMFCNQMKVAISIGSKSPEVAQVRTVRPSIEQSVHAMCFVSLRTVVSMPTLTHT